jgi:hypothetical protein
MKSKHTHCCILCFIALLMCNALKAAVGDRYTLVKSTSELANDDEIIIASKKYGQTVGTFSETGQKFDACSITLNGDDATISNKSTTVFIINKTDGNYYIKTKEGGKYIAGVSDKESSVTLLKKKDKILCKTTFKFYDEDHHVEIAISNKSYKIFDINNTNNVTGCIWKLYNVTSKNTYIYKKASSATTTDITLDGLSAEAKNVEALNVYEGKIVDKITINRSFAADGGWYTLCLPFALTADDIKTTFKDALFNEFENVSVNAQGVAQLKFKKVTETKAGVPYMVLPREVVNTPVFTDKTIKETTPKTITRTCKASDGEQLSYQFVGVYDPKEVSGENNVRFVGGNQGTELLIPDGKGTMKGLRAYFVFPNNTNGNITLAKLNVEDDSTTGINTVLRPEANVTDANSSAIYTLSGQKVQKKNNSLIHGMYIQNGKKFIVK